MEFESSSGKGTYTAKAIQLAKIAINIKISNGLARKVKENTEGNEEKTQQVEKINIVFVHIVSQDE